jgi:hypothetical protein
MFVLTKQLTTFSQPITYHGFFTTNSSSNLFRKPQFNLTHSSSSPCVVTPRYTAAAGVKNKRRDGIIYTEVGRASTLLFFEIGASTILDCMEELHLSD